MQTNFKLVSNIQRSLTSLRATRNPHPSNSQNHATLVAFGFWGIERPGKSQHQGGGRRQLEVVGLRKIRVVKSRDVCYSGLVRDGERGRYLRSSVNRTAATAESWPEHDFAELAKKRLDLATETLCLLLSLLLGLLLSQVSLPPRRRTRKEIIF